MYLNVALIATVIRNGVSSNIPQNREADKLPGRMDNQCVFEIACGCIHFAKCVTGTVAVIVTSMVGL